MDVQVNSKKNAGATPNDVDIATPKKPKKNPSSQTTPTTPKKVKTTKSANVKIPKLKKLEENLNESGNIDGVNVSKVKATKKRPKVGQDDTDALSNDKPKAKKLKANKKVPASNASVVDGEAPVQQPSSSSSSSPMQAKPVKEKSKKNKTEQKKRTPSKEKKNNSSKLKTNKKEEDVVADSNTSDHLGSDVGEGNSPTANLLEKSLSIIEQQQHGEHQQSIQQLTSANNEIVDTQECLVYG